MSSFIIAAGEANAGAALAEHAAPVMGYRQYHGAALVAWVFSAADWWLSRRSRRRFCDGCFSTSINIRSTLSIACGEYAMMRRKVDTTRTARVCQIASLLLILMMVLGLLVQDIMRKAERVDAALAGGDKPARLVVVP